MPGLNTIIVYTKLFTPSNLNVAYFVSDLFLLVLNIPPILFDRFIFLLPTTSYKFSNGNSIITINCRMKCK
jgi:hypothetical protein